MNKSITVLILYAILGKQKELYIKKTLHFFINKQNKNKNKLLIYFLILNKKNGKIVKIFLNKSWRKFKNII